jgi:hypothetical protein
MYFLDIVKFGDIGININLVLFAAISVIIILFVIKYIINRRELRKINKIIDSYKSKKKSSTQIFDKKRSKTFKKKSPFVKRERKSGLTWGGGNIKGANPSRGTKKEFLK